MNLDKAMACPKCSGRLFLDRVFSDNKNFELYCVICGARDFVDKESEFGTWLAKAESQRLRNASLVR